MSRSTNPKLTKERQEKKNSVKAITQVIAAEGITADVGEVSIPLYVLKQFDFITTKDPSGYQDEDDDEDGYYTNQSPDERDEGGSPATWNGALRIRHELWKVLGEDEMRILDWRGNPWFTLVWTPLQSPEVTALRAAGHKIWAARVYLVKMPLHTLVL